MVQRQAGQDHNEDQKEDRAHDQESKMSRPPLELRLWRWCTELHRNIAKRRGWPGGDDERLRWAAQDGGAEKHHVACLGELRWRRREVARFFFGRHGLPRQRRLLDVQVT